MICHSPAKGPAVSSPIATVARRPCEKTRTRFSSSRERCAWNGRLAGESKKTLNTLISGGRPVRRPAFADHHERHRIDALEHGTERLSAFRRNGNVLEERFAVAKIEHQLADFAVLQRPAHRERLTIALDSHPAAWIVTGAIDDNVSSRGMRGCQGECQ